MKDILWVEIRIRRSKTLGGTRIRQDVRSRGRPFRVCHCRDRKGPDTKGKGGLDPMASSDIHRFRRPHRIPEMKKTANTDMTAPARARPGAMRARTAVSLLLAAVLALSMTPAAAFADADLAAGSVAGGNLESQSDLGYDPYVSGWSYCDLPPRILHNAYLQGWGWDPVWNGFASNSGATGYGRRIEAFKSIVDDDPDTSIRYRAHVQNLGWQGWKKDGQVAGLPGKGMRVEAFEVKLVGGKAAYFDVYYCAYIPELGWTAWAKNGAPVGSQGYGYRIESLRIKPVKKGDPAPDPVSGHAAKAFSKPLVKYRTHVQNQGWQSWRGDGKMSGTSGKSLRLEGLNMKLGSGVKGGISYRTHVQGTGWQDWKSNGQMSGTSGKSKRLEAVQVKLTGAAAKMYDVYYRVHAQHYGWMGWAKNGAKAGTAGHSYRLEGLQVKLVKKGAKAPGSTKAAFRQKGKAPTNGSR